MCAAWRRRHPTGKKPSRWFNTPASYLAHERGRERKRMREREREREDGGREGEMVDKDRNQE
jgi:hypothetical protein